MFTVLTPLTDPRSSLDRTLAVVTSTDSHESMSTNKIIYYTGVLFSSQNENKSIIIKKSLSAFMVYYKIPYNYFMTRGLINVPVPETLIIRFSAVVDRAPNEIEHNWISHWLRPPGRSENRITNERGTYYSSTGKILLIILLYWVESAHVDMTI